MQHLSFMHNTAKSLCKSLCLVGAFLCLTTAAASLFSSCTDSISEEYSSERAFFHYASVSTNPPLYQALNNPGVYCRITFDQNYYHFQNTSGVSYSSPRTALDVYGSPRYISGFIVGTPTIPDLNGNFYQVAYDLVCPTCYNEDAIQRSLTLSGTDETATCSRCKRVYSLRNNGIVTSGDAGAHLKRYRMTYAPATNVFNIAN